MTPACSLPPAGLAGSHPRRSSTLRLTAERRQVLEPGWSPAGRPQRAENFSVPTIVPLGSFPFIDADRQGGSVAYPQAWTQEVSDALVDVHLELEALFGRDGEIDDAEQALLELVRRANGRVGEVDRNIREYISVLRTGTTRPQHERERKARRAA
jgi:hypothetical protein